MKIEYGQNSFERPTGGQSVLNTLRGVNRATYTLFFAPSHEKLHREVANLRTYEDQPLQPSIPSIMGSVRREVMQFADLSKKRHLRGKELTQLAGVLIQFTDYVPPLQFYAQTKYSQVESLYNEIVDRAEQTSTPLTFSEQLGIALHQADGDLTESLWRLFITSRLYARWLDSNVVTDLPNYTHEEKLSRMMQWQKSLAACKTGGATERQDVSGDTYYVWTHALASVVYSALPEHDNRRTRLAAKTFEKGTKIMHNVVHRYNPQAIINDHSIAAQYGNAIGQVCANALSL